MIHVNPSEAAVERSFSKQKFIHTTLRNKLHKDTIDALMFVKVNTDALGMVNYDSNDTMINIDSEYTIVEWRMMTRLLFS